MTNANTLPACFTTRSFFAAKGARRVCERRTTLRCIDRVQPCYYCSGTGRGTVDERFNPTGRCWHCRQGCGHLAEPGEVLAVIRGAGGLVAEMPEWVGAGEAMRALVAAGVAWVHVSPIRLVVWSTSPASPWA